MSQTWWTMHQTTKPAMSRNEMMLTRGLNLRPSAGIATLLEVSVTPLRCSGVLYLHAPRTSG